MIRKDRSAKRQGRSWFSRLAANGRRYQQQQSASTTSATSPKDDGGNNCKNQHRQTNSKGWLNRREAHGRASHVRTPQGSNINGSNYDGTSSHDAATAEPSFSSPDSSFTRPGAVHVVGLYGVGRNYQTETLASVTAGDTESSLAPQATTIHSAYGVDDYETLRARNAVLERERQNVVQAEAVIVLPEGAEEGGIATVEHSTSTLNAVTTRQIPENFNIIYDRRFHYVHPAPPVTFSPVTPNKKSGQIHHLHILEKLSLRGRLLPATGSKSVPGVYVSPSTQFPVDSIWRSSWFGLEEQIVLYDTTKPQKNKKNLTAVAVIIKSFFKTYTFKMYGFKPYHRGQMPSHTKSYQDQPLYLWITFVDESIGERYRLISSDELNQYNAVVLDPFSHKQRIKVMSSSPSHRKGANLCALLTLKKAKQGYWGKEDAGTHDKRVSLPGLGYWDTIIGPGIDPCLMIGLAAVVDIRLEQHRRVGAG